MPGVAGVEPPAPPAGAGDEAAPAPGGGPVAGAGVVVVV